MSVYAMATNAEQADAKSYLVALKDYIPAEGLAIYIFAIGYLAPADGASGRDVAVVTLVSLIIGMVATAVITVATLKGVVEGNGVLGGKMSELNRRRIVVVAIAWSALLAYVLATLQPIGIPVATVDLSRYLAVGAALWALVLPFVATALGVRGRS